MTPVVGVRSPVESVAEGVRVRDGDTGGETMLDAWTGVVAGWGLLLGVGFVGIGGKVEIILKVRGRDGSGQRMVLWWKGGVVLRRSRDQVCLTMRKLEGIPNMHWSSHHDDEPCSWKFVQGVY